MPIGGRVRTYRLVRPPGLHQGPSDRPAPLVVVLHGGFGSGAQAQVAYGWDALAAREGFAVAYPDGIGRSWNAGTCCGAARRSGVDDVAFIEAVVADAGGLVELDPFRVYVTGISNGGMLAYRLACELPGLFAAIGPVAATMVSECPRPAPLSILHIHGLQDRFVPFAGGVGPKARDARPRPSVASVMDYWRRGAGCGPPTVSGMPPVRWESAVSPAGVEVALISLEGVGHVWPGSRPPSPGVMAMLDLDPPSQVIDATAELWSFFARHPAAEGLLKGR